MLILVLSACSPAVAPAATLDCAAAIDALDAPPSDYTVVLDAVALDLAEHPTSELDAVRYAKTGLVVRTGTAARLVIPEDLRRHLSIGWGSSGRTWDLAVPSCSGSSPWQAFAGGFYVDEPRCAELVVRTDHDEEHVLVGVGTTCDGPT